MKITKDSIIVDNDPRMQAREGVVLDNEAETGGRVHVRWSTGRVTMVDCSRIFHGGKPRKSGYSLKSRGPE